MQRKATHLDWRTWSLHFAVLLCCVWTAAYFAYHARHGRHGFEARARLIERTSMLAFEIASLEAVRSALARDVALLTPEQPAADIIEESARDILGYAYPSERLWRR